MTLRRKITLGCAVFIGSIAVIIGTLALTFIDGVINNNVLKRDYLGFEEVNGSRRLNSMTMSWLRPAYYMEQQIWMFHLENEQEVLRGRKPRVREIGPFTFIEKQWKSYHEFAQNDTKIFYRNNHLYTFNESLSCPTCSLDRRVVIPNVVFQKLVDFASYGYIGKLVIEGILKATNEAPFVNVTVREALFDGYHDKLIDAVCQKKGLEMLCRLVKIPQLIGFFYGQNNTDDGLFEVSTGLNAPWNIGAVHTFNNMSALPDFVWDSKDACEIRGTDGQLFSPLLKEGGEIEVFAGPICRTVTMEFRERSEFRGIAAFRYGFPANIYDPSVPVNRGFCNKNNTPVYFNSTVQIPGCLPKGLLDISRCLPGTPRIYISQPHFLNAPFEVQSTVEGMRSPDVEKDDTFVEIEPTSGVPIHARRMVQINVGMLKGNLEKLSAMNNLTYPVLWLNETVRFDDETREQLNTLVFVKHMVYVVGVSFLTAGLLVFFGTLVTIVVFIVLRTREEDEHTLLQDESVEEEVGDI
ncbi:CD36 family protein [Necator americanus]|uniref:CD36 family protein n=1 Tax=Necator americanus TaxID=51031 RepID=W2T7S9_NECAM|nr:CD36 family protein [Necator americanus]ETN77052.1 CD36 family protein [Necator americanus]